MNRMAMATLGMALTGCSAFSAPAPAPVPAPPVQTAAQSAASAARAEEQAATRDSSATPEQIKGIQGRLARERDANGQPFYRGPIDGRWGPATAGALRRYQHARGLEETGLLNHETLESFRP